MVREQIKFMKKYREVIQFGEFYRLVSPFDTNFLSWMVVSQDKKIALVGWYKILNEVNGPYSGTHLQGLDPNLCYHVDGDKGHFGNELMNIVLIVTDSAAGLISPEEAPVEGQEEHKACDFDSHIFVLKA